MARTLIGKLLVALGIDNKGLDTGLNKSRKKLSFFEKQTKTIGRAVTRNLAGLAGAFAIGQVVNNAARTVMGFDQAIADLSSITGKSRDQMDRLVDSAIEIGSVSSFSASEVVSLQTELAKLGNSESDILNMTKAVGDFSVAVGASASEAATLAGAVLKSFNKESRETEKTVSALALATTKSALDFAKLQVALPIVGAAANATGVSLERTTALLGVLADNGIDASTAATALRNIFIELTKNGLTFDEAMDQILNSSDQLNTAFELFDKRGSTVALTLAKNRSAINDLEMALGDTNGVLKEMTDKRLDTLQGRLTLAQSAWEGFILAVDEGDGILSKTSKTIIDNFTDSINTLTQTINGERGVLNGFNRLLSYLNPSGFGQLSRGLQPNIEGIKQSIRELSTEALNDDFFGNVDKLSMAYRRMGLSVDEATDKSMKFITGILDGRFEKGTQTIADGLNDLTGGGSGGDSPMMTLAEQSKALSTELDTLIESYVKSGNTDQNILADIVSKQAELKAVNGEIEKMQALLTRIQGGGGSVGSFAMLPTSTSTDFERPIPEMTMEATPFIEKLTSIQSAWEAVKMSAAAAGEQMGNSLAQGARSFKEFASNALSSIQQVIGGLLKQFVAGYLSTSFTFLGPFAGLVAPALGGLAAGIFNTALSGLSVPALASGGVVSSPTLAMVGEYPGATSNPEIIAPENKLRSIFRSELGGSGGGLYVRQRGEDLYYSQDRYAYRKSRTG